MNGLDRFSLEGRLALVSGASRGIGRRLAVGLASAGADLIVTARSLDALRTLCDEIDSLGRRCVALRCDVADVDSIHELFARLDADGLQADVLVNNAGVESVAPSTDVDEALWDRIVDTNLKGAFFVAQGVARRLLDAGRVGSVINLGSLTSAVGVPTATPYTASKSGLLGLTRALSSEWAPHGVRVNAIGPGYFRTELTEAFYRDDAWRTGMLAKIPAGRFGQLDDLVGVTVFLASDASVYLSGQILYVDGGYLASI